MNSKASENVSIAKETIASDLLCLMGSIDILRQKLHTYFLQAVIALRNQRYQRHYFTWHNVTELITGQKKPVADK